MDNKNKAKEGPNDHSIKRFDNWAKTFDENRISEWFKYIHGIMLKHLDITDKKNIIDIGCGTGSALMLMAKKNKKASYFGIDISSEMIAVAKKKTNENPNFEFKVADSASIPYPDESFDVVFSCNSFHHYPDPLKALREMKRILKYGGTFFLEDACRDVFFMIWLQNLYRKKLEKGHQDYYTTGELLGMIKKAGLKKGKLVDTVRGLWIKGKAFTGVGMFSATK